MNAFEEKINALVRPNIRSLKAYSSARDEFEASTSGSQEFVNNISLDANENSLGSPLKEDFSRYPDPQQKTLKAKLAVQKDVEPEQIFLGNGSDEAIDLMLRAFCEPGRDNVVLLPPTYGMYAVQANIHGATIRQAPLHPAFLPEASRVKAVTDEYSKLLFLCSPNNPTGNTLPEKFILEMLRDFPGLVVLDEAYIDFSEKPSWASRLVEFPNLVVLQTLSKAWGLAGLRVGMALANPFVINILNKIKYPYNLSTAAIRLAEIALQNVHEMREKVAVLLAERARMEVELPKIHCVKQVFKSDANFLLVQVADADRIYQQLRDKGIIVRNRSNELHCHDCLRITIGKPEENNKLLCSLL